MVAIKVIADSMSVPAALERILAVRPIARRTRPGAH